jgi:hypothetical protein
MPNDCRRFFEIQLDGCKNNFCQITYTFCFSRLRVTMQIKKTKKSCIFAFPVKTGASMSDKALAQVTMEKEYLF